MRMILFRPLLALAGLGLLAGCSSVQSLMPHYDPASFELNNGANPRPVAQLPSNPAEKPIPLPATSADIDCPEVDIAEGGAAYRVGGAESASVRYQFNIGDTARECDPAGQGQAAIKIGISIQTRGAASQPCSQLSIRIRFPKQSAQNTAAGRVRVRAGSAVRIHSTRNTPTVKSNAAEGCFQRFTPMRQRANRAR